MCTDVSINRISYKHPTLILKLITYSFVAKDYLVIRLLEILGKFFEFS
jgi:hypothetical protein